MTKSTFGTHYNSIRNVLLALSHRNRHSDTEWGKALGTGPEEGDPLFQLTKSQLLNKLLATKATGQSIETSEDPMMDQLLAARYRTYNSTAISIRTTG